MSTARDHRQRIYGQYRTLSRAGRAGGADGQDEAGRRPFYERLIDRFLPADRALPILELACGDGSLLRCLAARGYTNIAGVDRAAEQVQEAHARGTVEACCAEALDALRALPPGSQGAVISIDLIEHLDESEVLDLADEIHRVLAHDGRWILHTVNAESPFFGRVRYGDFTHKTAFTQLSLRQVAGAARFRSVSCSEDAPAVHGLKSAGRAVAWRFLRTFMRAVLIAETGSLEDPILSQNLFAVAIK